MFAPLMGGDVSSVGQDEKLIDTSNQGDGLVQPSGLLGPAPSPVPNKN